MGVVVFIIVLFQIFYCWYCLKYFIGSWYYFKYFIGFVLFQIFYWDGLDLVVPREEVAERDCLRPVDNDVQVHVHLRFRGLG